MIRATEHVTYHMIRSRPVWIFSLFLISSPKFHLLIRWNTSTTVYGFTQAYVIFSLRCYSFYNMHHSWSINPKQVSNRRITIIKHKCLNKTINIWQYTLMPFTVRQWIRLYCLVCILWKARCYHHKSERNEPIPLLHSSPVMLELLIFYNQPTRSVPPPHPICFSH